MKKLVIILLSLFTLNFTLADSSVNNKILLESPTEQNLSLYIDLIYEEAPSNDAFVAVQRLTVPHLIRKDWERAIDIYKVYADDFPNEKERIEKIIKVLSRPVENLSTTNIGTGVNTKYPEYSPIPTVDENTLYFTGYNRGTDSNEDIFVADKNPVTKKFEDSRFLNDILNNELSQAPQGLSNDGNTMIIFGQYEEKIGGGDLYYSERFASGWSEAKLFPRPLNSEYFDCDAKYTHDNQAIIFVSDRPGAIGYFHPKGTFYNGSYHGNTDIYISFKNPNGSWTDPINLGPKINTPYAERKPYLHPDGHTLYFSSEGHQSLGRLDFFKIERLIDTSWFEWSEPISIGKEINGPNDDWGAIVSVDGSLAFYASEYGDVNYGSTDIYSNELPDYAKPNPVAIIEGVVVDINGNTLDAEIIWEELSTNENVGKFRTNPNDGTFFIVLPLGKQYGYFANKSGYFPLSKNIDLRDSTNFTSLTEKIVLVPIKDLLSNSGELNIDFAENADLNIDKERNIRLNNLFFEYNKSILKVESFRELDRFANLIEVLPPDVKIQISGHTDDIGSEDYNQNLSEERSVSVVNYLVSKGINKDRLIPVGFGKNKPVDDNSTDEGRARNRRVEFKIVK